MANTCTRTCYVLRSYNICSKIRLLFLIISQFVFWHCAFDPADSILVFLSSFFDMIDTSHLTSRSSLRDVDRKHVILFEQYKR